MIEFIFYLFSAVLVVASLMVVLLRNPVHSVLMLILSFFSAAALFILLGAEFIAMTLIIVYVGAVAVLFLFVVMMLNINIATIKGGFSKNLPLTVLVASLIFVQMFIAVSNSRTFVAQPTSEAVAPVVSMLSNTEKLGLVLYTDYFLPFQLSGFILLTAMIGAIILTLMHDKNAKRQNIKRQVMRTREESVELVEVKSGEGVKL